jgi:hypothetical protein
VSSWSDRAQAQNDEGERWRCYTLCNAATGEATPVPRELARRLQSAGNIALACGGRLIVDLQPQQGGGGVAVLERVELVPGSDEQYWRQLDAVTVAYPPGDRPWRGAGAIVQSGLVHFVDLGQGLLSCDPVVDAPVLLFVRLPEGARDIEDADAQDLWKRRCVSVNAGLLLYFQMDQLGSDVVFQTWTLSMEDGVPHSWEPRSLVQTRSTLFASTVVALVHPKKPNVVCLCVIAGVCFSCWLAAFDLDAQRFVNAHPLGLPGVPRGMLCSAFFHGVAM